MTAWTQKGFALISDTVQPSGQKLPLFHAFQLTRAHLEHELKKTMELPDHLRLDIRIVEAELHFSDH